MKRIVKDEFLKKSLQTIEGMLNEIDALPSVMISDLKSDETALIVVDMVNGFAREGALKSSRVENLIPAILKICNTCAEREIKIVMFSDCHTEASLELESYPPHCMKGTSESELVSELKNIKNCTLINKNSTNGFLEDEFQQWIQNNKNITNFIIVGDCTDICVLQFSQVLKAYFNTHNIKSNIIVPLDCVDTFDGGLHDADLLNVFSVFSMMGNGIRVVKSIEE